MANTYTAPNTAARLHAELMAAAAAAPEYQNTQAETWLHGAQPVINSRRDYYFDGLATDAAEYRRQGMHEMRAQCEWLSDTTDADTVGELLHWADRTPKHLTFKTATGRLKLVNTKERLQGFADGMAKSKAAWQMWGGGNMPAELAKPKKAKPTTTWQTTSINVCVELFEDKLHADGLAMALDRLGGRAYWHNEPSQKNEPFLMIAPQPVEGLPERLASGRHAIGGAWAVFDTVSGLAIGTNWKPARSRAAAERIALNLLNDKTPEQIEAAFQRAKPNDSAEALARLCQVLKIEDTSEALAAAQARADELAAEAEAQYSTAADQVADVLAVAMAAVAIDSAQESAAAAELAEAAHTQADAMADVADDVVADVAELTEVAEPVAAMGGTPNSGTPGHTRTGHATPAQRSSSTPGATGGAGGQRVAGKSGRWVATFHTTTAGLPAMVYTGPDGVASAHEFDTGSQRMAALQRLAREADAAPAAPSGLHTPHPAAPQADDPARVCPADGTDYTHPLKTPEQDYTHPLKTLPQLCNLAGLTPAELVGVVASYTGDACNAPGRGAVVAVDAARGTVDVMLEDGRECHGLSLRSLGHKPGDRYGLKPLRHGADYLAALAAVVATRKAQKAAAQTEAARLRQEQRERLAVEFAHLERAEGTHGGGTFAARNIRTELKRAFPGVKFSVTSSYSSVRVMWTDGPTDAQVDAITDRYETGRSETQSDYFYTVDTPFSMLFGGAQYINTSRCTSDEFTAQALAEWWPQRAESATTAAPTAQDWKKGQGVFCWGTGCDQLRASFRKHLNSLAAPAPAKATRKAKA